MFNIGDVQVVNDLQNGSRIDSTALLALILELTVLCSELYDEQSNVITQISRALQSSFEERSALAKLCGLILGNCTLMKELVELSAVSTP